MSGTFFDERVAAGYDASPVDENRPEVIQRTVRFLAELAGTGPALELGVGTGRIALPLSERGVPVHGIDIAPPMIDQLRAKPGAEAIGVTIGDFATTRVDGSFTLVYLVYNTITNLITQDEQVECFRNAARHLEPGGCFVIEVVVPELQRLPPGETARVFAFGPSHVGVDELDVVTQRGASHHYWVGDGRSGVFSSQHRYVWPSELDLMAQLAGLGLRERWGGWEREPFTGESRSHVSVWEKAL